jgi:hypothetical protein
LSLDEIEKVFEKMSKNRLLPMLLALVLFAVAAPRLRAQSCETGLQMDPADKSAMDGAVTRFTQMAASGDSAGLQQSAIPSFTNVANIVSDNKGAFGAGSIRSSYLLDNTTGSSSGRAEFYCGIYNSPDRVGFVFPSLPAGKFGIVIQDVRGTAPYTVTWVLEQVGVQWRVAGLFPRPAQIGGHDANWFLNQARSYKQKGQTRNAWLYYQLADQVIRPFPAMTTPQLDKLYDEAQQVLPSDLPVNGPVPLTASVCALGVANRATCPSQSFQLTSIEPIPVGDNLDLLVRYQVSDASDSTKAFQDNTAVINALVNKYSEFRQAFAGVVARAVDPQGRDYGTLLAMKDLK